MSETTPDRTLVIACEVFFRELCTLAGRSPRVVDLVFLPKGLHDLETGRMRARVQEEIDRAEQGGYERIVLAYGLCNNGTLGLEARGTPLVIPRAHDCITLFFGSRRRYREYFEANPGTYYLSTGWIERGASTQADDVMSQLGLSGTYSEYAEKYGEDNAEYIMRVLGGWRRHYSRLAYFRMDLQGLPDYTAEARRRAEENAWEFDVIDGDTALLDGIVNGTDVGGEYILVPPGACLASGADDEVFSLSAGGGAR